MVALPTSLAFVRDRRSRLPWPVGLAPALGVAAGGPRRCLYVRCIWMSRPRLAYERLPCLLGPAHSDRRGCVACGCLWVACGVRGRVQRACCPPVQGKWGRRCRVGPVRSAGLMVVRAEIAASQGNSLGRWRTTRLVEHARPEVRSAGLSAPCPKLGARGWGSTRLSVSARSLK